MDPCRYILMSNNLSELMLCFSGIAFTRTVLDKGLPPLSIWLSKPIFATELEFTAIYI